MLQDDVLLEIFDFYRLIPVYSPFRLVMSWPWHLLVHVCRRWRQIVFESPRRLNLQIRCTHKTPVRKNLRIWPNFPIFLNFNYTGRSLRPRGVGNIIDALRLSSRVGHVELNITSSLLEKMVTVMQEPFPALTYLEIFSTRYEENLPGGFLGGSAPRLQKIYLDNLSFPALPTFLLSTSDLITLSLGGIPPSGYISPEVMIASLVALPRLENLYIEFRSPTPHPSQIRPPPSTRIVLLALTSFTFDAAREYLEDIVAQIDCPHLEAFRVGCLNSLSDVPIVQIPKFVDRSVGPKSSLFRHAQVCFSYGSFSFDMFRRDPDPFWYHFPAQDSSLTIKRSIIRCDGIGQQVFNIAQVLSRFSERLSDVVHLELEVRPEEVRQIEGTTNAEWLHLLRQFPAAQTLHVSQELTGYIALALEDVTEEIVTDILPLLELICLEAQPVPSLKRFVAVRRLTGCPVTVVGTMAEFKERLDSYISE